MVTIALAEAEEAEKEARASLGRGGETGPHRPSQQASGISKEEAIRRAIAIIERATKSRLTEVEVFRFPNQLCTDMGRAINQQEPGWEQTLNGAPNEIYQLWEKYFRPRGYKLKVQIVDFPGGGIKWKMHRSQYEASHHQLNVRNRSFVLRCLL